MRFVSSSMPVMPRARILSYVRHFSLNSVPFLIIMVFCTWGTTTQKALRFIDCDPTLSLSLFSLFSFFYKGGSATCAYWGTQNPRHMTCNGDQESYISLSLSLSLSVLILLRGQPCHLCLLGHKKPQAHDVQWSPGTFSLSVSLSLSLSLFSSSYEGGPATCAYWGEQNPRHTTYSGGKEPADV